MGSGPSASSDAFLDCSCLRLNAILSRNSYMSWGNGRAGGLVSAVGRSGRVAVMHLKQLVDP